MNKLGRILILNNSIKNFISKEIQKSGLVDVAQVYRNVNYFEKKLRTLEYHFNFINKECWYDDWKNKLNDYDTIILFDAFLGSDVIEYIENKASKARLIVYYWNPWENNYYPSQKAIDRCEIWSFDQEDCKKYGLKYNKQFYFSSFVEQDFDSDYVSDIFFVGKDKCRLSILMQLDEIFRSNNIKNKFYILPDRKKYKSKEKLHLADKVMPYAEVLKYNYNTKFILDIVQNNQSGITLRVVEALFFGKKLITNNIYIKEYDFYNYNDVYIIGDDDRDLVDFIKDSSTALWNSEIITSYTFEAWINRFVI